MRCIITTLILLSIPVAFAGAEGETYEVTIFDVSALCTPHRASFAPHLGPAGLVGQAEGFEVEPVRALEIDAIADIVRDTISPVTWDSGGDVSGREGGFLIVKAPRSVTKEIGDLLAVLESAHSRRVRFSVESHRLPLSAMRDVLSGKVDLQSGRDAGPVAVAVAGVPTAVSVTNRFSWLADYEVELATNTAIADPTIDSALEGLALDLTAWPTSDGSAVLLEVFVQAGRFARPIRELSLESRRPGTAGGPQLGTVQLPEYRFLASAATALVKPGERLFVPVVGRDGVELIVLTVLEVEGGMQMGPVIPAGALSHRPLVHRLSAGSLGFIGWGMPPDGAIWFGAHDGEPLGTHVENLMDFIVRNVTPERWEDGDHFLNVSGHDLYLSGDADTEAKVRAFVKRTEASLLRPVRVEFEVCSVAGAVSTGAAAEFTPADPKPICAGATVGMAGRRSFLVAGSLADHVADYEAEAVEGACMPTPIIARTFEGLAATVTARFTSTATAIEVTFDLLLARRSLPELLNTGADAIGPIELVGLREVRLSQTVRASAGGAYVLSLGPDPEDKGRSLALVIRPSAD